MTRRDVVWITLESVRFDHTSLGDYEYDTTPNLAELAADGASFSDCFSHDVWTRSATASILTGQAPSAHRTWSNDAKLPETIRTIPEAFQEAGYRTACISPNPNISPATGLDRGFEHFSEFTELSMPKLVEEAGIGPVLNWLAGFRQHTGGVTTDGSEHCYGYLETAVAKQQIRRAADNEENLFLYLHQGDPHHAYVPPLAWRDRVESRIPMGMSEAIDLALDMSDRLHEYIARDPPLTDEERTTLLALYDACIAYVDRLTGDLVEYAQTHLDEPIIVVTGDHGELFCERGLLAHMLTTDSAVSNVPMVVSGLDGLDEYDGLIQPADVMASIREEVGIDHPVPIGQDVRTAPRTVAVTQRGGQRAKTKLAKITAHNDAFPADDYGHEDTTALRTDQWVYRTAEDRSALVERGDGVTDISDDHPEVETRLATEASSWLESYGQSVGDAGSASFDEAAKSNLRELGYL